MKKNNKVLDLESVDSRYKNKKEKFTDGKRLLGVRLSRMNELSESQITKARLLQLKFQMESILKDSNDKNLDVFTDFK